MASHRHSPQQQQQQQQRTLHQVHARPVMILPGNFAMGMSIYFLLGLIISILSASARNTDRTYINVAQIAMASKQQGGDVQLIRPQKAPINSRYLLVIIFIQLFNFRLKFHLTEVFFVIVLKTQSLVWAFSLFISQLYICLIPKGSSITCTETSTHKCSSHPSEPSRQKIFRTVLQHLTATSKWYGSAQNSQSTWR